MVNRIIIAELKKWATDSSRKPLVLRGARQVGKTTLVHAFAKNFKQYIYLNLELEDDRLPFERFSKIETLIEEVFFIKNKSLAYKEQTLIFIDEIQEVPEALNLLRYFLEFFPNIPVIAAGSMLETLFNNQISFPVGRVEFKVLRPLSFAEFLDGLGETTAIEAIHKIPLPAFAFEKLMSLFHTYALIGGMPEVVKNYIQNKDLVALGKIYDALIASYMDDVEKYAHSAAQTEHIRYVIRTAFSLAGTRIKFEGFGNSTYRSRDVGEALRTLEKAMVLQLVFPSTDVDLPLLPDIKKSPKLQVLDTGMVNYFVGIQKEIIGSADLNQVYKGKMLEHLVGQELLAPQYEALSSLSFWVREKKTSTAEVDFIYKFDGKLIPIEVKAGAEGKLKSLHWFMDTAPHNMAVRFYAGALMISECTSTNLGRKYYLLNLPYFLASKIEAYLEWFQQEVAKK